MTGIIPQTVAGTAGTLFILGVILILVVAFSIMRIVRIKLNDGRLKDMTLPIIGGIIIPVILAGILLAGIVFDKTMNRAKTMIRLTICKKELQTLGRALQNYSNDFNGKYPTANQWCDLLVKYADVNKTSFGKFTADGHSNYAINPDAEANSPPDIVLLFETEGVWNQAGKAELLSVDNKESNGYMILFNGGDIKFLKPEDVNGLKWN